MPASDAMDSGPTATAAPPPKYRSRWSDEETDYLREHRAAGRTFPWIASRLGRSISGVEDRARQVGLRTRGVPGPGRAEMIAALAADAAEHGEPSPGRVAEALGVYRAYACQCLAAARKAGVIPEGARPSSDLSGGRAGADAAYRAEVEAAKVDARAAKDRQVEEGLIPRPGAVAWTPPAERILASHNGQYLSRRP